MSTKRELIDDENQSSLSKKRALDPSISCKINYSEDENLTNDIFSIDIVKNDEDFANEDFGNKTSLDSYEIPDSTEDITSTSSEYSFLKIEPASFSIDEVETALPETSNSLARNTETNMSQTSYDTSREFSIFKTLASSQPSTSRYSIAPADEVDDPSSDLDEVEAAMLKMTKYPSHPIPATHKRRVSTLRCVIERLIDHPFASEKWADSERMEIIKHGKPEIKLSDYDIYLQSEEFKIPNNYMKKVPWITGCLKLRILVCWPCLIAGDCDVWSTGYTANTQLMQDSNHHSTTKTHLRNVQTVVNLTKHYYVIMAQPGQLSTTQSKSTSSTDLIDKLITHHFLRGYWTQAQKRKIIRNGKPTPQIPDFKYAHFQKNRTYVRSFNTEHYSNIVWLTGSAHQKKLFCWPCLLFNHYGTWGKTGFNNLSNLSAAVSRHEMNADHLTASILLKAHESRIRMEQPLGAKLSLIKNQELLKNLTDTICYLKTRNFPSPQNDCLEMMKLMSRTDPKVDSLLTGDEAEIKNYVQHLTTAIGGYLRARLTQEVAQATFLSLIFSEVSRIDVTSWIAIIVRYVNEGGLIKERFVTYIVVKPDTSSDEIVKNVHKHIFNLQCASRVVGFTYDGSFANHVDTAQFHGELKRLCEHARFFPYKDHSLMQMVEQVLSRFVEVRDFFHMLSKINKFASRHKSALLEQDEELVEKLSKDTDVTLDLVPVVAKNYKAILRIFKTIAKKERRWSNQDILEARSFVNILLSIQCRFKIVLLHEVMPALTKLSDDFQSDQKFHRWGVSTMQFYSDAVAIKGAGWSGILSRAITLNGETEVCVDESISNNFVICFEQVLDTLSQLVLDRGCDLDLFAYYDIVCNDQYRPKKESAISKIGIYADKFQPIVSFWPSFDSKRLGAFLNFALWDGHISGATLLDKFNTIRQQRLIDTLPDLYRFLKLIFTIPMVRLDDVSAIKQLKKYAKERHELNLRETFLWMERENLAADKRDGRFYSEIRDHFEKSINP